MKRFITLVGALALGLSLAAVAAMAADEMPVTDEWNQPVYVDGAKGAKVQATTKPHFYSNDQVQSASGTDIKNHFFHPKQQWNQQSESIPEWQVKGLGENR